MIPLAFKYVVIALMMAEVNYSADKLQLKERLPITDGDIIARRATDLGEIGFAGGIDTPEYHFGFVDGGKKRVITKLEDSRYGSMGLYRGDLSMPDFMEKLSSIKSTIDTNDAYRLATNWLIAIGMDVEKLQTHEPLSVEQQFTQSPKRGLVPAPLFYVKWGDRGNDELGHHIGPVVSIMISGINGDLLSLFIENGTYSKRPFVLIKDIDKLLAIPDEKFLKYSDAERSNLIVRFSAVTCPVFTNATHGMVLSTIAANILVSQTNALANTNAPATQ
jgi:hypothetical protein